MTDRSLNLAASWTSERSQMPDRRQVLDESQVLGSSQVATKWQLLFRWRLLEQRMSDGLNIEQSKGLANE